MSADSLSLILLIYLIGNDEQIDLYRDLSDILMDIKEIDQELFGACVSYTLKIPSMKSADFDPKTEQFKNLI